MTVVQGFVHLRAHGTPQPRCGAVLPQRDRGVWLVYTDVSSNI